MVIIMNKLNFKNNLMIFMSLFAFTIISIISIYSAQDLLSSSYNNLYVKQILWYILGYICIIYLYNSKNNFLYKYSNILYIISIISLILVLIFGTESNGARCWFTIPGIGSIQPSEFVKIFLILSIAKELSKYDSKNYTRTFKNELTIIFKCFILTLIPSLLAFLEPDTGIVFIYFSILFVMLFVFGIRYRWFIISGLFLILLIGGFLVLFFFFQDNFISIFGTNFFYRMDRILDWSNGSGMQLTNALASTGSAGLTGYGISNTPIYFPEPQTDFIFSVFASNFGFFGSIVLILITIFFDMQIIKIGIKSKNEYKYIISGIVAMLLFQQIQNIGMNIGLLPITGITLPFISYGGSSLISYMVIIGIIVNINKKENNE